MTKWEGCHYMLHMHLLCGLQLHTAYTHDGDTRA